MSVGYHTTKENDDKEETMTYLFKSDRVFMGFDAEFSSPGVFQGFDIFENADTPYPI